MSTSTEQPIGPAEVALHAAELLDMLADTMDGWATESRTGGWSTHQVAANREAANQCRREAALIRAAIRLQPRGETDARASTGEG